MSRKYIKQLVNSDFVYPNKVRKEYDTEIIHNIYDTCVSGNVISFSATTANFSGITFTGSTSWVSNNSKPFIQSDNQLSMVSIHMIAHGQSYFKPWSTIHNITSNNTTITGSTDSFNVTVLPSDVGLTGFTSGTYYFEFRFIGELCYLPVCTNLNLSVSPPPTPTPTPTITPTITPSITPTSDTPTPTPSITPTSDTPTPTPTITPTSGCTVQVTVDNNATGGIGCDIVYVNGVAVTYDSGDDFTVQPGELGFFSTNEIGTYTVDVSYTAHTGEKSINLVDCNSNAFCIDALNTAGGTAIFENVVLNCPCGGGLQIILNDGACL